MLSCRVASFRDEDVKAVRSSSSENSYSFCACLCRLMLFWLQRMCYITLTQESRAAAAAIAAPLSLYCPQQKKWCGMFHIKRQTAKPTHRRTDMSNFEFSFELFRIVRRHPFCIATIAKIRVIFLGDGLYVGHCHTSTRLPALFSLCSVFIFYVVFM